MADFWRASLNRATATLAGLVLVSASVTTGAAQDDYSLQDRDRITLASKGKAGSPFIPVDSWIYPAALRLHDLGYLSTLFVSLRPYTRLSLAHALLLSKQSIADDELNYGHAEESVSLYRALEAELTPELQFLVDHRPILESSYARLRGITGPVLNDSFHLGQTYSYDYGRPYQEGLNAIAGASGYVTYGRMNLYVRGEYQHASGGGGYPANITALLAGNDGLNPAVSHFVVPAQPIAQRNLFRLVNALVSVNYVGHQIAFGRSDEWLGPAAGGSMAWSNNSEPIYAFRINRVEPLYIPLLERITGPFRYEFFVGSLKGHDTPNAPWVHMEKANFKPTKDLEFGFSRVALWGGKGHVPVTLGTFFRSFFSPAGVQPGVKGSRKDPGARFSTFDFTYRVPAWNHLFTVYADSFVHDNVFPVSNPRRAAVRTGLLLSRLPHAPRVDFRAEGAYTDVNDPQSTGGGFLFQEVIYKDAYTNRGFLLGDTLGREGKGGNVWLTFHQSPKQDLQLEYRRVKAAKDFVLGGTTQQDITLRARFRPTKDLEFSGSLQQEFVKAPLLSTDVRRNFGVTAQLTWYPH